MLTHGLNKRKLLCFPIDYSKSNCTKKLEICAELGLVTKVISTVLIVIVI